MISLIFFSSNIVENSELSKKLQKVPTVGEKKVWALSQNLIISVQFAPIWLKTVIKQKRKILEVSIGSRELLKIVICSNYFLYQFEYPTWNQSAIWTPVAVDGPQIRKTGRQVLYRPESKNISPARTRKVIWTQNHAR